MKGDRTSKNSGGEGNVSPKLERLDAPTKRGEIHAQKRQSEQWTCSCCSCCCSLFVVVGGRHVVFHPLTSVVLSVCVSVCQRVRVRCWAIAPRLHFCSIYLFVLGVVRCVSVRVVLSFFMFHALCRWVLPFCRLSVSCSLCFPPVCLSASPFFFGARSLSSFVPIVNKERGVEAAPNKKKEVGRNLQSITKEHGFGRSG